jgi:hypothetical protein
MKTIYIDKFNYHLASEIIENTPIFSKGCRNAKEFLKKKNIPTDSYIFIREVDGVWTKSDGKSNKFDKVAIRRSYINENQEIQNELKGEIVKDENGIEKAPEILILDDSEKFHDEQGNVLEIETRGERQHDKIFFKVNDVANVFEMKNIYTTIIKDNTSYKEHTDYKYFICNILDKVQNKTNKKTVEKELFLTYEGIIHVLYGSHSKNAMKFRKWATETLFTVQMGTIEQKHKLCSNILGVDVRSAKEVFDTNASTFPSIYLFSLGYVKDIRQIMNIDLKYKDNQMIFIYGCTKELQRRMEEHYKYYLKKGITISLKRFSYIDTQYIFKAEKDVKDFMTDLNCHYSYEKEKEMILVDDKQMKKICKRYDELTKIYMGHITEIMNEKKDLEHKLEISESKLELSQKDNELLKKDNELIQQRSELLELKYQLAMEQKGNDKLHKNLKKIKPLQKTQL